nr:hypothetical protein [Tanacetum cinerariifolium]
MPPKHDLVFNDAPNVNETIHTAFNVELSTFKLDKELSHRPLAPNIEDWVSDSEDDSEAVLLQNTPSFVHSTKQVKTLRPSVKPIKNSIPAANHKTTIPKPKSYRNNKNRKEPCPKGKSSALCKNDTSKSPKACGNMSYLSKFDELNAGYVAFGRNPKGGKIFGKDTECLVLSPEFKLPDENQVLLRVPRENNMYNVDLKNIVPSGDLTCLFAKATLDESNLWHRRLGYINFKTVNKFVKEFKDFSDNTINEVNDVDSPIPAVGQISTNSTNTFSTASPSNTVEEGINYEEVFAPVARIEAIRWFLAYASFMGFMVYQMDVKSAFLYGTIEEDVYVCQPLRFEEPDYSDKDKYVAEILRKFGLKDGKLASTPIYIKKPLLKDPDVMRIFRYLKGKPHLGLWYRKDSPFDLVAYSNSDIASASLDRKSTTGGCQLLRCRLISWQCKKQTVMATSCTEAEYVAAASCYAQVLWIQNQLLDYG